MTLGKSTPLPRERKRDRESKRDVPFALPPCQFLARKSNHSISPRYFYSLYLKRQNGIWKCPWNRNIFQNLFSKIYIHSLGGIGVIDKWN